MTSWMKKGVAALAVIAGLLAAGALGYAQARPDIRRVPPLMLTGNDIGFRVEGHKGTSVVGRFVVRINGEWIDADSRFAAKVVTGSVQK